MQSYKKLFFNTRTFIHGFSLIELSIVLVILGLLTGGILAGQSLIRTAELRNVSTEYQRYVTAVQTFRDKYFALPGDMPNAGRFWRYADTSGTGGVCGAPTTDTGSGTETCDGNGNGTIDNGSNESFRFWQHLANAGLIEGSYTGVTGSGGTADHAAGENAPQSRLNNALWAARDLDITTGSGATFVGNHGNTLQVGGDSNGYPGSPILSAEELWNIDTKLDDGMPATGRVLARYTGSFGGTLHCVDGTADTDVTSTYLLNDPDKRCSAIFSDAF